jgi:glutamine phosphoribosylpyrophosphate amidotransferase
MCGIFGVIGKISEDNGAKTVVDELFVLSESRGKEAAGAAFISESRINIIKTRQSASRLIKMEEYQKCYGENDIGAVIGHARLVTNGSMELDFNNQPVIKEGVVGVHNGIIVNDAELWRKHPDLKREYDVDTEILLALLGYYAHRTGIAEAIKTVYELIEGTASFAAVFDDSDYLLLSTNNGSLFYAEGKGGAYFASEEHILAKTNEKFGLDFSAIFQVKPKQAVLFDFNNVKNKIELGGFEKFPLDFFGLNKTRQIIGAPDREIKNKHFRF